MGPRLWNAIPENVKCHQTMEGFKNALNMFLRKRVKDLPPTVGYVTPTATLYATGLLTVRWPAKQGDLADKANQQR